MIFSSHLALPMMGTCYTLTISACLFKLLWTVIMIWHEHWFSSAIVLHVAYRFKDSHTFAVLVVLIWYKLCDWDTHRHWFFCNSVWYTAYKEADLRYLELGLNAQSSSEHSWYMWEVVQVASDNAGSRRLGFTDMPRSVTPNVSFSKKNYHWIWWFTRFSGNGENHGSHLWFQHVLKYGYQPVRWFIDLLLGSYHKCWIAQFHRSHPLSWLILPCEVHQSFRPLV